VLIYKKLIGVTPFFNRNKNILLMKIKSGKVVFPDRKKYKIDYSDEIMDLIIKLLEKDRTKRLGAQDDFVDILNHPALAKYAKDIKALENKTIKPPFIPNVGNDDFTKFFNAMDSKKDISDTYIPRENRNIVQQNKNVFDNFNKKTKK